MRADDPRRDATAPTVVVAYREGTARVVLDPDGVTVVAADPDTASHVPPPTTTRLAHSGTSRLEDEWTTWAWGSVPADEVTPRVRFASRTGLRARTAVTRRISARLWAARAAGRWPRVLVDGVGQGRRAGR